MKRNARIKDESLDQAILLAFDVSDAASPGDNATTEDQEELSAFRDTVSRLAFTTARRPRAGLKRELLSSLREKPARPKSPQVWKSWTPNSSAALHVVRAGEGNWEDVARGVKVKRLFADPSRDSVTMLIRMDPGSEYPPHRHGGDEECLVLEGDLHVGDRLVLNAGDYQCARTSSVHETQRTVNGCLLLIVSSMHDQLLA